VTIPNQLARPIAAGAEATEVDAHAVEAAARYSARYSPRNGEGAHAKILPLRGCQARGISAARSFGSHAAL
jgi:hypothetical protein